MAGIHLKLRGKLLISFIFITLLGSGASTIGLVGMYQIQTTSSILYESTTKPMINLVKLTDAFQRIGVSIRDAYLAGNEALSNKSLSIIEGLFATIQQNADEFEKILRTEEERNLFADFKTKVASYQTSLAEASNGIADMDALMIKQNLNKVKSTALLLQISLEAIIDAKITQADTDQQSSSQTIQALVGFLAILNSIGISLSLILGLLISRSLSKGIKAVEIVAKTISDGDLTSRIEGKYLKGNDEVSSLGKSIEAIAASYRDNMTRLKQTVEVLEIVGTHLETSVSTTSNAVEAISRNVEAAKIQVSEQSAGVTETSATTGEILKNLRNLDSEIENQSASVTQSSASVEEMVGNIQTVARNVNQLSTSFCLLTEASDSGNSRIKGMMAQIDKISTQSESLIEANRTIASIAAQTNLLAMNAAIEAAHAGSAGLGFAVVADEIRKLAELAGRESKEVSQDIKQIKGTIDAMVSASGETSSAFASISDLIKKLGTMEQEITQAMVEQGEGSRQVLEAISSINTITSNVHRNSSEIFQGSQAIAIEMQELTQTSLSLNQAMNLIGEGIKAIQDASAQVREVCTQTTGTVHEIAQMVSCYRTDGCVDDDPDAV